MISYGRVSFGWNFLYVRFLVIFEYHIFVLTPRISFQYHKLINVMFPPLSNLRHGCPRRVTVPYLKLITFTGHASWCPWGPRRVRHEYGRHVVRRVGASYVKSKLTTNTCKQVKKLHATLLQYILLLISPNIFCVASQVLFSLYCMVIIVVPISFWFKQVKKMSLYALKETVKDLEQLTRSV